MRYALVNGEKQEATKNMHGHCLCCNAEVTAKCGENRVHHWAHVNKEECTYSNKEPKTQWHINWQDKFRKDWQEVKFLNRENGEVHIADIKTPNGLVVEFQHSHIDPEERSAREHFYKNMIWVVDGTRLKNDFDRFLNNITVLKPITRKANGVLLFKTNRIDGLLPKSWLSVTVPLYFDFRVDEIDDMENDRQKLLRNLIWGFFRIEKQICVIAMTHDCFIDEVKKGTTPGIDQDVKEYFIQEQIQVVSQKMMTIQSAPSNNRYNNISCGRTYNFSANATPKQINRMKSQKGQGRF